MKEAIAILTGGGPAPGMNTVVGSVAKTFLRKGYRVIGLHEGYTGLFNPSPRMVDIDYLMADGNSNGKYWQDADYSRIYLTSAKYFEQAGGKLSAPTSIPGTNTAVMIRNKTGQVMIWDGSSD